MLRSDHQKTLKKNDSLAKLVKEKLDTIKIRDEKIQELTLKTDLQKEQKKQIAAFEYSIKENKINFKKLVYEYIKDGLVSISTTKALLELDKTLNSSQLQLDLLKYKELQTLVIDGKSLFKNAFNTKKVKNLNSSISKNSNWQSKSPLLFKQLEQLQGDVEYYQELLCEVKNDIEDLIAANISDESKKKRIRELTNSFDSDIYPYLFNEVMYSSKNLKNRLPQIKCN